MHQTWDLFYSRAMKTLPMSCHVSKHVHGRHMRIAWRAHASKPAALIIRGAPGITYGCTIRASQTIFIKINRLTFKCPKYKNRKPERAGKDSHCHAQQEHGCFK